MRRLCALATPLLHRLTVFLHTANLTLESSTLGKWTTRVSKPFKQYFFWRANNLGRVAALRTQPLR